MTIMMRKLFLAVLIALCFDINNAQQRCRGQPDGNMFPLPERTAYVVCQNQQESQRNCRAGSEFDPFARECRSNSQFQSSRNQCYNLPEGTYLADPSNRNRFFYCINGEAIAGNCPQQNEVFNVDTASCEFQRGNARPASPPRGGPPSQARPPRQTASPPRQPPQRPSANSLTIDKNYVRAR